MTKDKFANEVRELIKEKRPELEVVIHEIQKVNVKLTGLTIREEGDMIAPTIYIDDMIADNSVEAATEQILHAYDSNKGHDLGFDGEDITKKLTEASFVLERVEARLINVARNEELLKNTLHMKVADGILAKIYYISVGKNEEYSGSVLISNQLNETIGLSLEEIDKAAMDNIKDDYCINSLVDTLVSMMQSRTPDIPEEIIRGELPESPIYIVSNKKGMHGAIQILNSAVQGALDLKWKDGVLIIPSSIHELLVIDINEVNDQPFSNLIKEVNETSLSVGDILGDEPFFYKNGEIKLYTDI